MSRCVRLGTGPCKPASSSCRMSTALGSGSTAVLDSASELTPSSLLKVSEPEWQKALWRQPAKAKRRRGQVAERGMPTMSDEPAGSVTQSVEQSCVWTQGGCSLFLLLQQCVVRQELQRHVLTSLSNDVFWVLRSPQTTCDQFTDKHSFIHSFIRF